MAHPAQFCSTTAVIVKTFALVEVHSDIRREIVSKVFSMIILLQPTWGIFI